MVIRDTIREVATVTREDIVMIKQEAIKDCLDNIDIYPDWEIEEILHAASVSIEEFIVEYDKEFG